MEFNILGLSFFENWGNKIFYYSVFILNLSTYKKNLAKKILPFRNSDSNETAGDYTSQDCTNYDGTAYYDETTNFRASFSTSSKICPPSKISPSKILFAKIFSTSR